MKKPTIHDVARAAGVSKSTVSRYLNRHPYLSAGVRTRIEAAIRDLNYHVNPLVSSLMAEVRQQAVGRSGVTIGWLNNKPAEDYWQSSPHVKSLFKAVKARAAEVHFGIDSLWVQEKSMTPSRLEQILRARGIHALLIPPESDIIAALPGFNWDAFAVASIAPTSEENYPWHSIGTDATRNAEIMLTRLDSLGYRRVGFLLSERFSAREGHAMVGRYLYWQLQFPKARRLKPLMLTETHSDAALCQSLNRWVDKEKPDAIICGDSRLLHLLQSAGHRVPQDIALAHVHIAQDVADWSGLSRHSAEKGAAAVDLLQLALSQNNIGSPPLPRQLLIAGQWVQGKTTR